MLAPQKSRPPQLFQQQQQQQQQPQQALRAQKLQLNHLTASKQKSSKQLEQQQQQHLQLQYQQQRLSLAPVAYRSAGTFGGAHTISRASNLSSELIASANRPQVLLSAPLNQPPFGLSSSLQQEYLIRSPQQQGALLVNHQFEHSAHLRLLAQAQAHHKQLQHQDQEKRRNLMILQQQQQQQYYEAASAHLTLPRGLPSSGPATTRRRVQQQISRPLCRCRVMYLGSSVPHVSKNGLHGIQEPLRHLYPEEQFAGRSSQPAKLSGGQQTIDISHLSAGLGGIDSWLSVWSNGLLLENFDELGREVKRFFAIESLHYCAAVRFFDTAKLQSQQSPKSPVGLPEPTNGLQEDPLSTRGSVATSPTDQNNNNIRHSSSSSSGQSRALLESRQARFLPLDAPIFGWPDMLDANHPPVFAAILRRTTGVKVLECHAFICRRDAAANALVRCCTHSYADHLNARRVSLELGPKGEGPSRTEIFAEPHQRQKRRDSSEMGPIYEDLAGNSKGATTIQRQHRRKSSLMTNGNVSNRKEAHVNAQSATQKPEDLPKLKTKQEVTAEYAIISRSRTSVEKEEEATKKGSSRSLYTDFQVSSSSSLSDMKGEGDKKKLIRGQIEESSHAGACETQRLSQSLELLERTGFSATCCPADSIQRFKSATGKQSESEQQLKNVESSTGRNSKSRKGRERHSRSMQDLENEAAHYPGMMLSSHAPSTLTRRRARQSRRCDRQRRSRAEPCYSSSSSSVARKRSTSRRRRSASVHDIVQLDFEQAPSDQQQEDASVPPSSSRTSLKGVESSRPESSSRVRSITTTRQHRSHPQRPLLVNRLPPVPIGGNYPIVPVSNPLYLPPPALLPAFHQHIPAYPSAQSYMSLQPTSMGMSGPYQSALIHPQSLALAQHQAMMLGHAPFFPAPPSSGKSASRKCQTLARFRCLSPPAAFGLKPRKVDGSASGSNLERSHEEEEEEELRSTDLSDATPAEVVSAEPGFMVHRCRENSARPSWIKRLSLLSVASSSKAVQNGLHEGQTTMSNPQGESSAGEGAGQEEGKKKQLSGSIKEPKKQRSMSLFAGSLTLGRRRHRARTFKQKGVPG